MKICPCTRQISTKRVKISMDRQKALKDDRNHTEYTEYLELLTLKTYKLASSSLKKIKLCLYKYT